MKRLPIESASFQYVEKSFGQWLDILGYSQDVVNGYPVHIRELFYYFEQHNITHINKITTKDIRTYYEYLKHRSNTIRPGVLSNGTLNRHLDSLCRFMDYLRQSGRIDLPPLEIRREESDSCSITILTVQEVQELYRLTDKWNDHPRIFRHLKPEALASRDRAMLTLLYGCGLRRNEAHQMDIQDINFDKGILHVRKGKNNKERFVPFNKTNSNYLQEYIYDYRHHFLNSHMTGALLISLKGHRLGHDGILKRLHHLKQRTDDIELHQKKLSPHTLRHSIATHLLQAGMSLEKISRFLGHSSLESTQIYTHLRD